jgi:hypothetical protein
MIRARKLMQIKIIYDAEKNTNMKKYGKSTMHFHKLPSPIMIFHAHSLSYTSAELLFSILFRKFEKN